MDLRLATTYDLDTISSILTVMDTVACKNSDITYLTKILLHWDLYVAVENCEIVWVVVYRISEDNCEIVALCAKSQRTWVGYRIIKYLENICRNQHIKKLRCRSFEEFEAQWFYNKMWFTEQYLLKQQFHWCDTRFFWKIIEFNNK